MNVVDHVSSTNVMATRLLYISYITWSKLSIPIYSTCQWIDHNQCRRDNEGSEVYNLSIHYHSLVIKCLELEGVSVGLHLTPVGLRA